MSTYMSLTGKMLAVIMMLTALWTVQADDSMDKHKSDMHKKKSDMHKNRMKKADSNAYILSDKLLGVAVFDSQGEEIGEVEDLAFHLCQGTEAEKRGAKMGKKSDKMKDSARKDAKETSGVRYALIAVGGVMGIGEKEYLVPWKLCSYSNPESKDARLTLSITQDALKDAPVFKKKSMDKEKEAEWKAPVDKHYHKYVATSMEKEKSRKSKMNDSADMQRKSWLMVSDITGLTVKNTVGLEYGQIEEVILDSSDGNVEFCTVSLDERFFDDDHMVLIPVAKLTLQPQKNEVKIHMDTNTLREESFDEDEMPEITETYIIQLRSNYDIASSEKDDDIGRARAYAPAKDSEWRQDSRYNKLYRSGTIASVGGTVQRVEGFTIGEKNDEGLQLIVNIYRETDIERVPVQLGPRKYVESKLDIGTGDEIFATGSVVRIEGKKVLLARKIGIIRETVSLRSNQGRPVWDKDESDKSDDQDQGDDTESQTTSTQN